MKGLPVLVAFGGHVYPGQRLSEREVVLEGQLVEPEEQVYIDADPVRILYWGTEPLERTRLGTLLQTYIVYEPSK